MSKKKTPTAKDLESMADPTRVVMCINDKGKKIRINSKSYRKRKDGDETILEAKAKKNGVWYPFRAEDNPRINSSIIVGKEYRFDQIEDIEHVEEVRASKPRRVVAETFDQSGILIQPEVVEGMTKFFDDDRLNKLANDLINMEASIQKANIKIEELNIARFKNALMYGKRIAEEGDYIKDKVGSEAAFAQTVGLTAPELSNRKRAFAALKDHFKTEDVDDMVKFLKQKHLPTSIRKMHMLPKYLNETNQTDSKLPYTDKQSADERRLQEINEEAGSIAERRLGSQLKNVDEATVERIKSMQKTIEDLQERISENDYLRRNWTSKVYRDFVKSLGIDMITGNTYDPEALEIHHTYPDGSSGGQGTKPNDLFGIPVHPDTHDEIEAGMINPDPIQIMESLVRCMGSFIVAHVEGDN